MWRQPDNQVLARVGGVIHPVLRVPGEPEAKCLQSARTIGVVLQDRKGRQALVPVDDVLGRRKALVQKIDRIAGEEFARSEVCILGDGTMALSLCIDHIALDGSLIWRSESDDGLGHELEPKMRDGSLPPKKLLKVAPQPRRVRTCSLCWRGRIQEPSETNCSN